MKRLSHYLCLVLTLLAAHTAASAANRPIYIIGDVDGSSWTAGSGLEMTYNASRQVYTAHITYSLGRTSYFILSDALCPDGNGWTEFNASHRLGGNKNSNDGNYIVTPENMASLPMAWGTASNIVSAFELLMSENGYDLELDLNSMTLKVTGEYPAALYATGLYGNWNPENAFSMKKDAEGNYLTYVGKVEAGTEFMLITYKSATAPAYGASDNVPLVPFHPKAMTTGSSKHFKIDKTDYYSLYVNSEMTELTLIGPGDIDGNCKVDGADLNILINIVLGKDGEWNYDGRADVDHNYLVDGSDINALINILLNK